nr:hypothetical protein [Deltaproteobacteria bacterium]
MRRTLFAIVIASSTAVVHAAPKPAIPGAKHNPPRFIDESSVVLELLNQSDAGWGFKIEAQVFGAGEKPDFVRVDWKQGGKVLGSTKCEGAPSNNQVRVRCSQTNPAIKARGDVTADLIYVDDKDDQEYLVRTFKINAKEWTKSYWGYAPDDLLASAWAVERNTQTSAQSPHPRLRFWIANSLDGFDAVLRCTVDGKPLPDLPASFQSDGEITLNEAKTWRWNRLEVSMATVLDGPKDPKRKDAVWLADNPGKWACAFRYKGRNLRELLFTVTAKGEFESHPMQSAPDAAPLAPGISLIDIRIPKDAGIDKRIKPDQLKKSRGFGLAWPKHPSVAATHTALPPAVENADPKPPPKVAGKVLPGLSHSPPRYLDESRTSLRARGRMDGYILSMSARVIGFTSSSDRFRLDLKSGGKVAASIKCGVNEGNNTIATVECENDEQIKAPKGKVDAELIYIDDQDGQDYLVRTFKVDIINVKSWGDPVWIIPPDDLLASAWVRHVGPLELHDAVSGHPHFVFWAAHQSETTMSLRCTVNGTKVEDIELSGSGQEPFVEITKRTQGKPDVVYKWSRMQMIARIHHGNPKDYQYINDEARKKGRWLIDNPGAWACDVRHESKVIRQLNFTVDAKGMIQDDPMMAGKGGTPQFPGIATIDIRIPKDSKFDSRIRTDVMKKSRGFG